MKWTDILDGCYCISLRSCEDRYQKVCQELRRVGLHNITDYYRPDKHPKGGRIGCWLSHVSIMQIAKRKKQRYILILEDDVQFMPNFNLHNLSQAVQIFRTWPDYVADILYLGHVPFWMKPTIFPQIYETHSLTTHAYIINTHSYLCQQITRDLTFRDSIDIIFFKYAKAFAVYPMMVIQQDNGNSNIQNKPAFIQKFTEMHLWPRVHILEELMTLQLYHFLIFALIFMIFVKLVQYTAT